jgi:hypothetical protein
MLGEKRLRTCARLSNERRPFPGRAGVSSSAVHLAECEAGRCAMGKALIDEGGEALARVVDPSPGDAISWKGHEAVLLLAKACPVSPEVERIISTNTFNSGSVASRHAVYAWTRKEDSLDTVEKRATVPVVKRANVVKGVMKYITTRLIASFVSVHEEKRQALSAWILARYGINQNCSTFVHYLNIQIVSNNIKYVFNIKCA